ncbi:hypothetical protein [Haloferula sp.]|uniref:hypothetical protein n=1 Tax=Haloferula sp. TaxID=2497595 RepID=UPI00329CDDFE
MGTDLFTSSRGPGVIGTFMAIFVLIGFGVLYILVFDKSLQGGEKTIESVIAAETKNLNGLKNRIASARGQIEAVKTNKKTESELEQEKLRAGHTSERLAELQEAASQGREKITAFEVIWDEYKQAYRVSERAAAEGEQMDELKTLSGKTYTKVKITDVDAVRMQIRHSAGITGIPFEELPLTIQDRFQFDAEEKQEMVDKEEGDRAKGHIGSSIGDLKLAIADLKHQNSEGRKSIEKLKVALSNAKSAEPDLKRQLTAKKRELSDDMNQRSNRTSTGRQGISKAPQIREAIASIESKISLAGRLIPQLSQKISDQEQQVRNRDTRLRELQKRLDSLVLKMKEEGKKNDS